MKLVRSKSRIDGTSLLYIAMCSKNNAPGVYKKIEGFVKGARSCGYSSRSIIIEPGGLLKYIIFIYKMAFAVEKYVVIRYVSRVGIMIFAAGTILRARGRRLYIDIPTPMRNHLREIYGRKEKKLLRLLDKILIVMQGPLPFQSAAKLIQYAEESLWYSIGVRSKTIKIGNGVDVASIQCRDSSPIWPAKTLNLVAVGTIAFWHGWDKVIHAIRLLKKDQDVKFDIKFNIVGEGPDLPVLKALVKLYHLSDDVKFFGMLNGQELYNVYKDAHFGIGSLGWLRLGVEEASPLKIREYLAAGLCVITATKDPDFVNDEPYILRISDQEDCVSLLHLLKRIDKVKIPSTQECRSYAEEKLDFKHKIRLILPPL